MLKKLISLTLASIFALSIHVPALANTYEELEFTAESLYKIAYEIYYPEDVWQQLVEDFVIFKQLNSLTDEEAELFRACLVSFKNKQNESEI